MLKRTIIMAVLVLMASMVLVVAPASAATNPGFAWIRVAHASPDAPAVDIWVNGQVVVSNLAFAKVTGYLLVPAGGYNIKVTPTGATTPVVIDANVTLEKNKAYTVAAANVLASIEPLVFVDDNSEPGPGMARANFIHLSPDAPAVDVRVQGGPVLFANTAFKSASTPVMVPAGTYTLEVVPAGAPGPVVLTLNNVALSAGTVYTVFAEGLLATPPPPLQAVFAAFAPEGHVWYLAEGCTEADFETWILVQNPNDAPATVGLTFMTEKGAVAGPSGVLQPNTRFTWKANDYVKSWNVSTEVTSNLPVVAERAMYNTARTWGHDSIGVTSTASTWYLPEGATAGGFETFVLIQNPNPDQVTLNITFMTSSGLKPGPTNWPLPGHSRITFYVNQWGISDFNVSTMVKSTGGGVICERAMYGNNRAWAHNSIGYAP